MMKEESGDMTKSPSKKDEEAAEDLEEGTKLNDYI